MDTKSIAIVGGCGHVGIPLGIALAMRGHSVTLVDINQKVVADINDAILPFHEDGAKELLAKHIGKNLRATEEKASLTQAEIIFFVTGTPVDKHHNPCVHDILNIMQSYLPVLNKSQLIILRSTLFPGVVDLVYQLLIEKWGTARLAFCPERISQGKGIEEIFQLPQLVSATTSEAEDIAANLFLTLTQKIIRMTPREAELAKLITNSWRYLEFSIANQFYMMCENDGQDFFKIYHALKEDYPRAERFARSGLTAGPCLLKDIMQLSAFCKNNFLLGQAGMLINEGLPEFLADQMEKKLGTLHNKTITVLGMTFKANNDDIRGSLSFKLKKILEIRMAKVIASDVFLEGTTKTEEALKQCDGIILGVPHKEYCNLTITKPFVDCWGVWKKKI